MSLLSAESRTSDLQFEVLRAMLTELSILLGVPSESSQVQQSLQDAIQEVDWDTLDGLTVTVMRAAQSIGIRLAPMEIKPGDAWQLLLDGFPVAIFQRSSENPSAKVFSSVAARHCEMSTMNTHGKASEVISKSRLLALILEDASQLCFIAQPSLACLSISSEYVVEHSSIDRVSSTGSTQHDHGHEHVSPQVRMLRLLKLEKRDIWTLTIFGFVVGLLDLATPLAVEQMVTTIGFPPRVSLSH